MNDEPVRAPLAVPPELIRDLECGVASFGTDAIIRTSHPETLRCGSSVIDEQEAVLEAELVLLGDKCTPGCKSKNHRTYAECLRDKGVNTYLAAPSRGLDGTAQKRWDNELNRYYEARREGIQPDGTTMPKVMEAIKLSDQAGAAYGRDFSKATPMEG